RPHLRAVRAGRGAPRRRTRSRPRDLQAHRRGARGDDPQRDQRRRRGALRLPLAGRGARDGARLAMPASRSMRRSFETTATAERPRRILVVDDAEGIRAYLATLLELRGYQVDTAEDGRRALALLEAGADPDVGLMDVMRPGMDGVEH